MHERYINWLPLPRPQLQTWPKTQACALGIELATLFFTGQRSIHWATPAKTENVFPGSCEELDNNEKRLRTVPGDHFLCSLRIHLLPAWLSPWQQWAMKAVKPGGQKGRHWNQPAWICTLALILLSCTTSSKLLNLSGSQVPDIWHDLYTFLLGLHIHIKWGCTEEHKELRQCLYEVHAH